MQHTPASSGQVQRPATTSFTIGLLELGQMLNPDAPRPDKWLQRNHQHLTLTGGMPAKLPSGWVWSRVAIMAWIETYGVKRQAPAGLTIGPDELGRLIQPRVKRPAEWMARHHQRLTEEHGMPRKLPAGWVWPRIAIMAWINTFGAPREDRVAAGKDMIREQQNAVINLFRGKVA